MKNSIIPIKREEFFDSLETYCSLSKSSGKLMALILIHVDNFSQVTQEYDYKTSESFIKLLFSKIEVLAKFYNCAFRINDSTFALILPVIESQNMLPLAANKILKEIQAQVLINEKFFTAKPSLGMSVNEPSKPSSENVYKHTEQLLLLAQEKGESFVLTIDSDQVKKIDNFSEKFRSALANNAFELYYQPKKNLQTGKVSQVEALLRWALDETGFINPEDIIREAEKSNENNFNLTKWVVNTALRQLKSWRDENIDMSVSINISASLIHRFDMITMIQDALKIWSIAPHLLTIEITETAFMTNKEQCHENLKNIRNRGIELSIDDFGTGYSSLSYFKQIPANELKIDKSFILNLIDSKEDRKLVRLMVAIARTFQLRVVAEGIENKTTYNFLKEIGCDYAQGYYIAKPMPADALAAWWLANDS